jgi:hypothetical protein
MLKQLARFSGSVFNCALLAMCVAVISWGLQSKLSLYSAPVSRSADSIAKLSTEKNSSQTVASIRQGLEEPAASTTASLLYLATSLRAFSIPSFSFHQVEVSLCSSCRCDSQGPDIMHRPPPTLS